MTASSARPLVAVVTPVYNGARFLETAIAATQAQSYRPLVHCILDNASTDATPEIIARAAGGAVPILTRRNNALLPQVENFNAALSLIPPEARFFKILCADDSMTPDAISEMAEAGSSAPDVMVVSAIERVNGVPRPHNFPPEASLFESSNAIARVFADDARLAAPHVMFRTDAIRRGEDFFDAEFIGFDVEVILRVLARGGKLGFVHKPILESIHHEAMLTNTLDRKVMTTIWERFVFLERYGPYAFSNSELARVRRYRRRVVYRRLLWWRAAGRGELFRRDLERLKGRGLAPSLWDYVDAVLSWPAHWYAKRLSGEREPRPWPADAVKPGG
jgi:glycosyltransferase involved in cell wall biosynthesis